MFLSILDLNIGLIIIPTYKLFPVYAGQIPPGGGIKAIQSSNGRLRITSKNHFKIDHSIVVDPPKTPAHAS